MDKFLLIGNTTINDLKIISSKLFENSPKSLNFIFHDDFYEKIKKENNIENLYLYDKKELD